MTVKLTVPLGVVVMREAGSRPWEDFRWRTVRVVLDPVEKTDWHNHPTATARDLLATTEQLVLQREEAMSYRVNLANGEPSVYVVLRHDPHGPEKPVAVRQVTASPFEARSNGDPVLDWVDRVPMPARLVTLIESFIAASHSEVMRGSSGVSASAGGSFEP
ncbi:MAG: DUF3305 domain-containing protein [Hyphomicrobiaceae bacterium]|nr:DUF3305 domain-containing protein [Hyphomicrobiaceae bacterium]